MEQTGSGESSFFDVITDKQTYLNMIYLMLSFPLGIFYFVYIVTGFFVGISLIPIFIGVPILYVFMISVKYLMKLERRTATLFLGINFSEDSSAGEKGKGLLKKFWNELFDKELWKALVYLTLKFFVGILIFSLCISLASLSLGLIAAPIAYQLVEYNLDMGGWNHFSVDGIQVSGLLGLVGINASPEQEMLIFMVLGVFTGIGSMHLINKTAYLLGRFLKQMSPISVKN